MNLTPNEIDYLRVMAEKGHYIHKITDTLIVFTNGRFKFRERPGRIIFVEEKAQ